MSCRYRLAIVLLIAMVIVVGCAWAFPLLTTDTCCRYAPMAEAFAVGDWSLAFHPRFCLGMPIVAGSFKFLTGVDGYRACTIVAAFAWVLSIIPLFLLARRIFDERTAWFAVVLYLIGPTILMWSLKGLREPFKILGLLMMVDSVFGCQNKGWRNLAEASLGLILLIYFKVDSVLFGLLLTLIYMLIDRFRVRSWILLGELVLFLQPCCLLVYVWTGKWLPVLQLVKLWQRVFGG